MNFGMTKVCTAGAGSQDTSGLVLTWAVLAFLAETAAVKQSGIYELGLV